MTDGRDRGPIQPEVLLTVAETRHLEEEIAAWTSNQPEDQAKASSSHTAEVRRRMQLAAASERALLRKDNLYNPSMLELPAGWRRPGEKWLAVFREKQESAASTAEDDATWYSFSLVLAFLDDAMRPTRPAKKLRSEDLFEHGGFDCQLAETDTAYFGPADARLFLSPGEHGQASKVLLFFTTRAQAAEPNTPCPVHGGQRMYTARINSDLTASLAAPLLIPGEEEARDGLVSASPRITGAALHEGEIAGVGHLGSIEKNWAAFSYRAAEIGNATLGQAAPRAEAQTLVEYKVEPHVIMDFDESSHRVGGNRVWKTSSSVVQAWLARRNAQFSETHAAASVSDIHGGVGALLMQAYAGRPKVFVSVLHARFADSQGRQTYHSYMYTFEAAPPFRVLGVAEKELPLVKKDCRWGAAVAFPMSLVRAEGPNEAEVQLLYGSGDSEAHRLIMPSADLESFLPARHELVPGQPGLTLVMMSHSRERFQDLKEILRHYRAMTPGLLEEIILIWNNPQDPGAVEELQLLNSDEGVPMQVIAANVNSMNNRFAVWEVVSTEGVIIQDDDMWVDEADLSCLVEKWRADPERLVGASGERVHMERDATGHLRELAPRCEQVHGNDTSCKFWGDEYSMLLPHPWVLAKRYMQLYTASHEATAFVDSMQNCDDIYLNAVVSNYTRAPPVAVSVPVHRYPTWADDSSMWASDGSWSKHRTQCLEKVNSYYAGEPISPDTGTVFRLTSRSLACPA